MEAVQPVSETTQNQTLPRDRLTTLPTELFASICQLAFLPLLDDDDDESSSPWTPSHRRLRYLGLVAKAFLPFARRAVFSRVTVSSDARARQLRDLVLHNDGLGSYVTELTVTECVGTGILEEEPSDSDSSDSDADDDSAGPSEGVDAQRLATETQIVATHSPARSEPYLDNDISEVFPNRAVFTSFLKRLPRLQRLSVSSDVGFWGWLLTPPRDDLLPSLEQLEITVSASRRTLTSLAVLVGLKRYRCLFALKIIVPSNTKAIRNLQKVKLRWVTDLSISGQHFKWAMIPPLLAACTRLERLVLYETSRDRLRTLSNLSTLLQSIEHPYVLDTLSIKSAGTTNGDRLLPPVLASFSSLTHLQLGRGVNIGNLLESIVGLKHIQELTFYAGSPVKESDLLYILRHRPPRLAALDCYFWPSDFAPFRAPIPGHADLTAEAIVRVVAVAQDVAVEIKGYSERYARRKVRQAVVATVS